MSKHGFAVQKHFFLPTAWQATYTHGKGGRAIGINSEMDALPGIGHACGHNLIAISGVGVACAIKDVMEKFDISGKILVLGTPGKYLPLIRSGVRCLEMMVTAEEGGYGKSTLLDKGAYKQMDACLMCVTPSAHLTAQSLSEIPEGLTQRRDLTHP
jgi:metal-dependent amidase/aminoacylase/carboxypeptidase family protein